VARRNIGDGLEKPPPAEGRKGLLLFRALPRRGLRTPSFRRKKGRFPITMSDMKFQSPEGSRPETQGEKGGIYFSRKTWVHNTSEKERAPLSTSTGRGPSLGVKRNQLPKKRRHQIPLQTGVQEKPLTIEREFFFGCVLGTSDSPKKKFALPTDTWGNFVGAQYARKKKPPRRQTS